MPFLFGDCMKDNYFKEFLKYVLPNIAGLIGISVYILADTFFVARGVGANGLAALNVAIPSFSLISGFGLMLGMGGGTNYTINMSRGNVKKANGIFTLTVVLGAAAACLCIALGFFGGNRLAYALGADENIFEMTVTYLRVLLMFSPAFIFNNILSSFVRNLGLPGTAMTAMIAGSFANIVFDYIFIFPLKMGIFGAVIATVFSPVISILINSISCLYYNKKIQFDISGINAKDVFSIVGVGLPSFISEIASGVVIFVFNYIIFDLKGNMGIAAYGIVANISIVIAAIFTGMGQGIQPLISREYGKCNMLGVKKIYKYAIKMLFVLSGTVYALIFVLSPQIAMLFNKDGGYDLETTAILGLKLYFTAILFMGFNIIMTMYFAAMEKQLAAQIISLMRGILVIIPCAFIMSFLWKEWGLWLSFTITEFITAAFICITNRQKLIFA